LVFERGDADEISRIIKRCSSGISKIYFGVGGVVEGVGACEASEVGDVSSGDGKFVAADFEGASFGAPGFELVVGFGVSKVLQLGEWDRKSFDPNAIMAIFLIGSDAYVWEKYVGIEWF